MPEPKDVNVAPSPTNDDVFEEAKKDVLGQEPSPDQTHQATQDDEVSSTQDVKPEVGDSRPVENVAWEAKRKIDELYPIVSEIRSMLEKNTPQQQPQQPQYSKAQLQAYASSQDTTTEQRLWAYGEIDKMDKEERMKEYQEIMRSTQEKSQAEVRKGQSMQWVAQTFPDMIIKDTNGNPMGWNQQHPVLQRANHYLSTNKTLQNDPEGFAAAVKLAAFDLGVTVNKKLSQKVNRTVGELRKEQKKQLASTGGVQPKEDSVTTANKRLTKLIKEYGETGDAKIFQEIVKLRGLNPFM